MYKPWRSKGFFQFEIIINVLVSFTASFEYLCYRSTAIINYFTISVRGPTLESDVTYRPIDGLRAERVKSQ